MTGKARPTIVLLVSLHGGKYEFLFRTFTQHSAWHTSGSLKRSPGLGMGWAGLPLVVELEYPPAFPFPTLEPAGLT